MPPFDGFVVAEQRKLPGFRNSRRSYRTARAVPLQAQLFTFQSSRRNARNALLPTAL